MRHPSEVDPFDALMARQRLREAREDWRDTAVVSVGILLIIACVFAAFAVVVF